MVGLRRVALGRADAAILHLEQLFVAQVLVGDEPPELFSQNFVQFLGERLGQPIRDGIYQNGFVDIPTLVPRFFHLLTTDPAGAADAADVVHFSLWVVRRQNKIGLTNADLFAGRVELLTETVKHAFWRGGRERVGLGVININVVANGVGRPDSDDAGAGDFDFFLFDLVEHGVSLVKKLLAFFADSAVLQDLGVSGGRV